MAADSPGNSDPGTPAPAAVSSDPWTIQRILSWTTEHLRKHGFDSPRLESEILLAHAQKCPRIQLYANYHTVVSEETRAQMRELVKRRVRREPVAYLVGHKEFYSLEFAVEPGVFIPRPETETLINQGLEKLTPVERPHILELCTGSGCIAVTLAKRLPKARVIAVEKNPIPLRVSRSNAEKHQVDDRVQILEGDLFAPVPTDGPRFDLIVSNPPYIRSDEIPGLVADVREHEPHAALDGGTDGLDMIRVIIAQAPKYLKPGGWLMLEMDPAQIEATHGIARQSRQWTTQQTYRDLFEDERCIGLQLAHS